jgi:hypothetical protein
MQPLVIRPGKDKVMNAVARLAPRIPAAVLALSLALGAALNLVVASRAFADDPMSQDIDFRNSASGNRRDTVTREPITRETIAGERARKDAGLKKSGGSK